MIVPMSATETSSFFPPSLGNLEPRPSFRFRPPTPRSKRRYQRALTEEGLRFHPDASVEAETLRAMRDLWVGDAELLAANESRLQSFWETMRQAQNDPSITVDKAEANSVALAIARLVDAWPTLRKMNADNQAFNDDAPKMALGLFLAGWSGLETSFRMEDGQVPLEVLDMLEAEIDKIEAKAIDDNVEGVVGIAFQELALHALGLMGLSSDTEKNSPSPSLPSENPDGSTAGGSAASTRGARSASTSSRPGKPRRSTPKRASS